MQSIATFVTLPPSSRTCCGRRTSGNIKSFEYVWSGQSHCTAPVVELMRWTIFSPMNSRFNSFRIQVPNVPKLMHVRHFGYCSRTELVCRAQELLWFDGLEKASWMVRIKVEEWLERLLLQPAFPPNSFWVDGCQYNWPNDDSTQNRSINRILKCDSNGMGAADAIWRPNIYTN